MKTERTDELLPCPICGSKAKIINNGWVFCPAGQHCDMYSFTLPVAAWQLLPRQSAECCCGQGERKEQLYPCLCCQSEIIPAPPAEQSDELQAIAKLGDLVEKYETALGDLISAMGIWGAEEDGIHPDAWLAFANAHALLGWALDAEPVDPRDQ